MLDIGLSAAIEGNTDRRFRKVLFGQAMLVHQLFNSTLNAGCLATAGRGIQRRVEPSFIFPCACEVICHQAQAIQGWHEFGNLRTLRPIVQFARTDANGHGQLQIAACFLIQAIKHLASFKNKCGVIFPIDTWITNIFVIAFPTGELKVKIDPINEFKRRGCQPHFKAVNEFCAVLWCRDHLKEWAAVAPSTN